MILINPDIRDGTASKLYIFVTTPTVAVPPGIEGFKPAVYLAGQQYGMISISDIANCNLFIEMQVTQCVSNTIMVFPIDVKVE